MEKVGLVMMSMIMMMMMIIAEKWYDRKMEGHRVEISERRIHTVLVVFENLDMHFNMFLKKTLAIHKRLNKTTHRGIGEEQKRQKGGI
jgi:hypothetical protein